MSLKTLMESEMEHGWQARVESTTLRIWDTGWGLLVLPWRLNGDPMTVPSDGWGPSSVSSNVGWAQYLLWALLRMLFFYYEIEFVLRAWTGFLSFSVCCCFCQSCHSQLFTVRLLLRAGSAPSSGPQSGQVLGGLLRTGLAVSSGPFLWDLISNNCHFLVGIREWCALLSSFCSEWTWACPLTPHRVTSSLNRM